MAETFTLYKLIILYMLNKVDFPLTTSQISEFVLDKGYTSYFKLQEALSELTESELIQTETTHNRTLYHLTGNGAETIHYFSNKISSAIRRDIDEFLKTKAAAMTMVEYMMNLIGLTMEDVGRFYVAGAFGTHFDKESAVTIGLYPDIDREKIISPGNTSLQGAEKLLLDRSLAGRAREIIERMEYVQFGAVEDFIHLMAAATAIPHTDLQRYPSVVRRLEERRKNK